MPGLFLVDVDLFCFLAHFLNLPMFQDSIEYFSAITLISIIFSNFLIFSFFQASRMFLMGEISSNTPSIFILFSLFTFYYVYLSFIVGTFHMSSDAWLSIHFHEWSNDQKLWVGVQATFGAVRKLFYWRYSSANMQFVFSPRFFFSPRKEPSYIL